MTTTKVQLQEQLKNVERRYDNYPPHDHTVRPALACELHEIAQKCARAATTADQVSERCSLTWLSGWLTVRAVCILRAYFWFVRHHVRSMSADRFVRCADIVDTSVGRALGGRRLLRRLFAEWWPSNISSEEDVPLEVYYHALWSGFLTCPAGGNHDAIVNAVGNELFRKPERALICAKVLEEVLKQYESAYMRGNPTLVDPVQRLLGTAEAEVRRQKSEEVPN